METSNHQQHPLQNELVLDTLLKHLTDFHDIKNARLVCRAWWTTSLRKWRELGVLVVLQDGRDEDEEEKEGATNNDKKTPPRNRKYPTLSELLELMNDSSSGNKLELEERPFQRIKLKGWTFDEYPEQFLEIMRGSITYLHLEDCIFPEFAALDKLLTAGHLPNLVKVVWSNSTFGIEEIRRRRYNTIAEFIENMRMSHARRSSSQFLQSLKTLEVIYNSERDELICSNNLNLTKFLCISPNLEEIIVRQTENDHYAVPCMMMFNKSHFFQGIACVSHITGKPLKLRSLDMMDFFDNAAPESGWDLAYELITNSTNLPLERFTGDVGYATSEWFAGQVLSALAGTLKVLHAFRAPFTKLFPNTIYEGLLFTVKMGALTELRLWGDFTTNLAFLLCTPHLQTLVLKRDCSDKWQKLRSYSPTNFLQFTQDPVQITAQLLERNGIAEPRRRALMMVEGLKHLDIDYNIGAEESIPTLASWLPNVTTLKMVLTSKEGLEAVSRAWPQLTELECLFGSRVDDDGVSCLLQMNVLESFKSNAYCGQGLLTSSSVNPVFLKMPALKNLDICVSSEVELTQKISHVKVICNDDTGDDERHRHVCCDRFPFLQ